MGCPSLVVAGVQHTFRKGWRQVSRWQSECGAAVGRGAALPLAPGRGRGFLAPVVAGVQHACNQAV